MGDIANTVLQQLTVAFDDCRHSQYRGRNDACATRSATMTQIDRLIASAICFVVASLSFRPVNGLYSQTADTIVIKGESHACFWIFFSFDCLWFGRYHVKTLATNRHEKTNKQKNSRTCDKPKRKRFFKESSVNWIIPFHVVRRQEKTNANWFEIRSNVVFFLLFKKNWISLLRNKAIFVVVRHPFFK